MNDVSESEVCEPSNPEVVWLDVRGEFCPVPALKAKETLGALPIGGQLKVWTTDPLAPMDLEVLCQRLGHRVVSHLDQDEGVVTTIEKSAPEN